MSDAQARKLLDEVRRVSTAAREAHQSAEALSAARTQIVQQAMSAGIPRQEIADAAGVDRSILYRLMRRA